jgi:hypothetical protein
MAEYQILYDQIYTVRNQLSTLAKEGWDAIQIAPINIAPPMLYVLMKMDEQRTK